MGDAPIFGQMKGLMEIHNPAEFHLHIVCGSQVINFQRFSYQEKGGFWVVFLRLQPQIMSDLYKILTSDAVQGKVSHMLWFLI